MPNEPSGVSVWSPKIRDEALVRKFLSLGGRGYVAISIQNGATAVDPDDGTLSLAIWFNDVLAGASTNPYGTQMATVTADSITKVETGKYYYDIGPALTANRGLITAVWTYQVDGTAFSFTDHLQILDAMPLYDSLSDSEKATVEQVSWMFGDLYDSTEGGPHLIEEFQTHWGYERIAQLMSIAVQKMNFVGNFGNPPTNWSVGGGLSNTGYTVPGQTITKTQTLPDGSSTTVTYTTGTTTTGGSGGIPSQFYGLTIWATYIECMRHFRDSYTELPARPGMDAVYADRRDYWTRWNTNLTQEEQAFKTALTQAKMSLLSMSRGSLLVAGGIYGGSARGIFQYGTYAAQVRSMRFYPAAPAIMWGATQH